MKTLVSIIICSFNRADILKRCLDSFLQYDLPSYDLQIIIVDNNSEDHTHNVVQKFASQSAFKVDYYIEKKVGLSHARNTGLNKSSSPWVFFLDDDAMITSSFYSALKECIDRGYYGFTGVFSPYYIGEKPTWLHASFGSKKAFRSDMGSLEDDYLCGNVMGFKTDILKEVGGFPTSLGMTGYKIAYGEETYVEKIFRQKNYSLGIHPKLEILHLVPARKQTYLWNLRSAYAVGKSQRTIGFVNQSIFKDSIYLFFQHSFIEIPKLLVYRKFKESYSLKYLSLKIMEPYFLLAGRIF